MREPLFVVGSDPVLARLRRLRVPVLVGALLGLGAGVAVHQLTAPTWTAQVVLELPQLRDRIDLNPGGARGQVVSIDTDAQMVLSDPVVRAVAQDEGRPERDVRAAMLVTARPLSRVMLISYTSRSADAASGGAVRAAAEFLRLRERAYLTPQLAFLGAVDRGTQSVPAEFDDIVSTGAVPSSENLRRRAFVQSLTLPSSGEVVAGPRMTSVRDRGDVEVPLTTGVASGAMLAILLVLAVDGARRRSPVPAPLPARPGRRSRHRVRPPPLRRVLAGGLVVTAVVTAVVGAAAYVVVPQRYSALALVYVPPLAGNAYSSRGSANAVRADLGTEAELARSDRVLDAVAAAPGIDATADALRPRIRTTPSTRGETIEITVTGSSAEGVEQVAALVAQESVLARQERSLRWTTSQKTVVGAAVSTAEANLGVALGPTGDETLVNAYNRRLTLLRADVRGLTGDLSEQGAVLSTRSSPSEDDRLLLLGAAAGGLVLGLLVSLVTRGATRVPFSAYRGAVARPVAAPEVGPA